MENNICFSVLVDSVGNRAHQRVSPISASKSRQQRLRRSVTELIIFSPSSSLLTKSSDDK